MNDQELRGESGLERVGKLSRRGAIAALGAAGVGFALFGPSRAAGAPPGRVVVDYWEKWTGQEGRAMRRIVDEFNALQDRIWVRYFSMSAIEQKALISIAGNDPPDLIGLQSFGQPAFLGSGALIPVDRLDAEYGQRVAQRMGEYTDAPGFRFRRELYTAPVWELMGTGGQLGGVIATCSTMAYYYNRAAYREVGLDPDQPPRTIAELDEHADRLTTRDADGRLDRAGFIHREPGWWNWIWGYHFGASIYDHATNTATCANAGTVRAYEWVQSYPRKLGPSRLVAFQSGFGGYNSTQQPLLAGKVASALHGPFLANVIETFKPDFDYGAAPFPVEESIYDPDRPIALIEGDTICVPRGARHPGEAYEFMVFTQLQRNLEALAKAHAKPSPLAVVSPGFFVGHPNRAIAMHNKLAASERAFPKPQTPVWPQYEAEFNAEIGTMWDLDAPAGEVLAGIQKRGQSFIDRHAAYKAMRRERDA